MTKANKLRDSNFGSRRQSIIQKYDKTGDGVFQGEEIDNILDDYMATMQNNNTLIDANSNQKKMLSFASIIIVILSLSNLGTAILAANISKETVVVDGRFVTNDGSADAISTRNSVGTVTKGNAMVAGFGATGLQVGSTNSRRNLVEDEDADISAPNKEEDGLDVACFTDGEVNAIFESAINGSGTNIVFQWKEEDGSTSRGVVPIHGIGHADKERVSFPNSGVDFVPDGDNLCSEDRRRMTE
eukprot:289620_1